jgi:hypothetical protein
MKKFVLMLLLLSFVVGGVVGCGTEPTTKKSGTMTEKDKDKDKDKDKKPGSA